MTTVADSVRALTVPIGDIGGRWMLDPEVLGPCRSVGYPSGFSYYVTGRGGVLGDVDADVVISAFGFFAPTLIRKLWEGGVVVEGARAASTRYGAACASFGRTRVAGFDGAARLAELAGRVTSDVDSAGLALFAGWRSEPLPDDAEGRAYVLMHVLRELRGSAHLTAVVASGLRPRDAVLAAGGAAHGKQFGWTEPFPDVLAAAKEPAESLTDSILAGLYASALEETEVAELALLVNGLREHLGAAPH